MSETTGTPLGALLGFIVGMALVHASLPAAAADLVLADPARMLATAERTDFVGANTFSLEPGPNAGCLRSTPNRSASSVHRSLDVDGRDLRRVRWSWRVDHLQPTADIRKLVTEDVGANIMFVFGEPSFFRRDVPTLSYVWTSTPVTNGTALRSRRYGSLVYIQVRGREDVGRWQTEERNVAEDFLMVFHRPPERLKHIGIFNDNDQTLEPTSAVFCPIYIVQ